MELLETDSKSGSMILKCYLIIEIALFIVSEIILRIMGSELIGAVRYCAVVLNMIVAIIWFIRYGSKNIRNHSNLIACGLLLTLVADLFLTLLGTENFYIHGFICFCIVELIYAIYLKTSTFGYLVRFNIYIIALILLVLSRHATVAYAIGLLNIVLVMMNALNAWTTQKISPPKSFKIGMYLFFLCDASVVIYGATTGVASEIFFTLAWLFYAPSQVLITLSYVKEIQKSN